MPSMHDIIDLSAEGIDINVDIVFVIDATCSMQMTIDMVKASALSFHEKLKGYLKNNGRTMKNLRIKVVWFRDFYYDGRHAYGESKFFKLPEERDDFHAFVAGINAAGGGDEPESALEALTLAMRSDFVQEGNRKRHIIVLFTDAEAHAFEDYDRLVEEAAKKGCKPEIYPKDMPKDLSEFIDFWQGNFIRRDTYRSDGEETKLDLTGRRLILFAPNAYPWNELECELENVIRVGMDIGNGGRDLDLEEAIAFIVHAI